MTTDMNKINRVVTKSMDIPELKQELFDIYNSKSHIEIGIFSVLLARHLIEMTNYTINELIQSSIDINIRWQEGRAKIHEARQSAFAIHKMAREEQNPLYVLLLRALGQIAATPHVKMHGLVATDYAIKIIDLMYPNNINAVRKEREWQISVLIRDCYSI